MEVLTNIRNNDVVVVTSKVESLKIIGRTIVFGMDSGEENRWHFNDDSELEVALQYVIEALREMAQ